MREYMLRVLNVGDNQKNWTSEQHLEFVKKCEAYIGNLKKTGKLIAAQPLAKSGIIISGREPEWRQENLITTQEIQVGYYHIFAETMDDAVNIAKGNPEFEYGTTARVEVRPITGTEESTGFVYPK